MSAYPARLDFRSERRGYTLELSEDAVWRVHLAPSLVFMFRMEILFGRAYE